MKILVQQDSMETLIAAVAQTTDCPCPLIVPSVMAAMEMVV